MFGKDERRRLMGHAPGILWFTGLSGSGKSTLASRVEEVLFREGIHTFLLDGDIVRAGLCKGLGFDREGRRENIRRIGEVSKLFVEAGILVLTAFISPYREERKLVRSMVGKGEFIEVFVKCPLEVCERRDVKGLYARARRGEIKEFTGIDDPYEEPEDPEITLDTDRMSIEECFGIVMDFLRKGEYIA